MQPATKPWLDDSKHLSERCVSVAFRTRTRGSAFAKMNSRHASPLAEVDPKLLLGSFRVRDYAAVTNRGSKARLQMGAGYAASCGTSGPHARVR